MTGTSDGTVSLSWNALSDATVTGYKILYSGATNGTIAVAGGATTTQDVTGLTNCSEYTFDGAGCQLQSGMALLQSIVTGIPGATPAQVTGVSVTGTGDGSVSLSWDSSDDATVKGYKITYTGATSGTVEVTGSATSAQDVTGLTNFEEYTFEVLAVNCIGDGAPSSSVTGTPVTAPSNLQATAGVGEVTLEWDDPGSAGITAYQLRYGKTGATLSTWSDISGSSSSTTEYTATSLTNGKEYTFRLRAKATEAVGDSSEVAATPVPAAPANLEASPGDGTVTLNWDDPGDAAITAYQLVNYSGSRPSQPTWNDISGSGATTTSHAVMNLTNGTEYTFELRAKAGSVYGDLSAVSASPKSPPPPKPPPCPSISVGGLPSEEVTATVGTTITTIMARASGGTGDYTYGTSRLPEGISIDTSTGDISGTVGAADYRRLTVTVTARDGNGCSGSGSFKFNVPCNVSLSGLPDGQKRVQVGELFTIQATASGGRKPYKFTLTGVPAFHVTMNKAGLIVGKIPIDGNVRTFSAKVSVEDRDLCTAAHSFNLIVYCPEITISGLRDVSVTVGDTISMKASGNGGRLPYSYSMRWAPSWLEIDEESGSIMGVPKNTYSGRAPQVTARDSVGCTGSQLFRLSVSSSGDFNGDGRRDAADAEMLKKKSGLSSSNAGYERRMDLNGDGIINFADLVILSGYIQKDASSQSDSESNDESE